MFIPVLKSIIETGENEAGAESDHDPLEMEDLMDDDSESGRSSRSSSIAARGSIPKEGMTELPIVPVKEEGKKTGKAFLFFINWITFPAAEL